MGVVWSATDTLLSRDVAVKVLQERYGPGSGVARRFADEDGFEVSYTRAVGVLGTLAYRGPRAGGRGGLAVTLARR
jgi:hypothetical protein